MSNLIKRLFRRPSKQVTISPIHRELSKEEKVRLRGWLSSEDTQLALRVLLAHRPSVFVPSPQGDHRVIQMADSARINQLRGWETCMTQIQSLGDLNDERKNPVVAEDWGVNEDY